MLRRSLATAFAGGALGALAVACTDGPDARADLPPTSLVETWTLPMPVRDKYDLLFVIADSSSMAGEQAALAANAPVFMQVLQQVEGGLADVHIGVVTADVGVAGATGVPGCTPAGDDGELLAPAACGVDGRFISDVSDGEGGRVRNYSGALDQTFACLARVGTRGCGYQMPLEAMRRALAPGKNPGFLRSYARLVVIIIADQDDCSTTNASLFADPSAGLSSPLGPLSPFRCFEQGIVCDGGGDPRASGTRTGCHPRAGAPYLVGLDDYATFLTGLKPDPSSVMVSVVAGLDDPRHTVVVGPDPQRPADPAVERSCYRDDPADANDGATPPIRLAAFLQAFPNRRSFVSICGPAYTDALTNLGARIGPAIGDPCVRHPLADRNAGLPGLQPECSFSVVGPSAVDAAPRERVLPPCAADSGPRCWELVPRQGECVDTPDHLSIGLRAGGPDPLGGWVHGQCVVR
ncbi:MAG TPA: hypothetical protein VHE35_35125 [Kofleriaceae bacterium]|nr:hypothetical protein [Kofleriaceae bacterium]